MKPTSRLLLLALGSALACAPVLRAGDAPAAASTAPAAPAAPDAPPPPPAHGHGKHGGDMAAKLAAKLNLTADQQAKWKDIGAQEMTAMNALRDNLELNREDRMAKAMDVRKSFMDQRRAVLTPDQQSKFDEIQAKMKARMKERMGDHHDAPPPPPSDGK